MGAEEALKMIAAGNSPAPSDVVVTGPVKAVHAFRLRKNGIQVPEDLITYNDEDLAYDADIDGGNWVAVPGRVDEFTYLPVELSVTPEINEWVHRNNVNVSELLTKLLSGYYQADQLVHKGQ